MKSYEILSDIFIKILKNNNNNDYVIKNVLILAQTFYKIENEDKIYIQERIKNDDNFKKPELWHRCINYTLKLANKDLNVSDKEYIDKINKDAYSTVITYLCDLKSFTDDEKVFNDVSNFYMKIYNLKEEDIKINVENSVKSRLKTKEKEITKNEIKEEKEEKEIHKNEITTQNNLENNINENKENKNEIIIENNLDNNINNKEDKNEIIINNIDNNLDKKESKNEIIENKIDNYNKENKKEIIENKTENNIDNNNNNIDNNENKNENIDNNININEFEIIEKKEAVTNNDNNNADSSS